jgi:hypothetical protein
MFNVIVTPSNAFLKKSNHSIHFKTTELKSTEQDSPLLRRRPCFSVELLRGVFTLLR